MKDKVSISFNHLVRKRKCPYFLGTVYCASHNYCIHLRFFFFNYALILCHYQSIRSYSHNMWYVNFGCTFARVHHTHTQGSLVKVFYYFFLFISYTYEKIKLFHYSWPFDVYRNQKFICGSFKLFIYFWIKFGVCYVSLIIMERECYFHFNCVVVVD